MTRWRLSFFSHRYDQGAANMASQGMPIDIPLDALGKISRLSHTLGLDGARFLLGHGMSLIAESSLFFFFFFFLILTYGST